MGKISEKGQITIPKKYREKFGLRPGDEVDFEEEDGKLVLKKEKTDFSDYSGYLGKRDTDEYMEKLRGEE